MKLVGRLLFLLWFLPQLLALRSLRLVRLE
ncbi:hypothetical protein CA51_22980 [Rosistilla oblonga]|nr:hypothetical protein CA51_22980 [Rosistilla oblonga]